MPQEALETASIYYESTGEGPPLIFAHGAGGNALSWWQQTAFFQAQYRCITFDHPGYRDSKWLKPENDPTAVYGNALRELLDSLRIEKAGIVAQSMGGWTSLRFAADNPDRVGALVMAATDGGMYLPSRSEYADHESNLDQVRKNWEERRPGSFHPAVGARMLAEQPVLHDMYVEIGSQNKGVSKRGWGEVQEAELERVQCPVLLITGEEDIVCPPRRVEELHNRLPNSEMTLVPEAGHSVYFERAEWFNKAVDEFLSRNYPANPEGTTILQGFANRDE